MSYIEVKHSYKRYGEGEQQIVANNDVNFEIEKGELVIILGSSGAGKSTLLNILGGMDTNDEGQILIDGVDIAQFNSHERTNYRRDDVGFVFQFYNLVANLTAKENVELASEIVKDAMDPVEILKKVGLAKRLNNFPAHCREENNSGFLSRVRWLRNLKSCSAMNQQEPLTTKQGNKSCKSCKTCHARRERPLSS